MISTRARVEVDQNRFPITPVVFGGSPGRPAALDVRRYASALHLGLGPVLAAGQLLVPAALGVLVLDRLVLAAHPLLAGGALGGPERVVVGWIGLGEDAVGLVGPAAVVLDDL